MEPKEILILTKEILGKPDTEENVYGVPLVFLAVRINWLGFECEPSRMPQTLKKLPGILKEALEIDADLGELYQRWLSLYEYKDPNEFSPELFRSIVSDMKMLTQPGRVEFDDLWEWLTEAWLRGGGERVAFSFHGNKARTSDVDNVRYIAKKVKTLIDGGNRKLIPQ